MMRRIIAIALCLIPVTKLENPIASNGRERSAPRGRLVVVGGGPPVTEIYQRALALAGGAAARVLIVPFASPDPLAGEKSASLWQEYGAANVSILDLADPIAAVAAVRAADLIWIRGGEQQRLMEALMQTAGLVDAIRERYFDGGTIGGTSAGAAVMSRLMIAGPAGRKGTPEGRLARLSDGLGLWPEVIVDQHFVQRRRFLRLLKAVESFPDLLGIGIDEATAVFVEGGRFEVVGTGPVIVYDGRAIRDGQNPNPGFRESPPTSGGGLGLQRETPKGIVSCTLTAGMKYDLDQRLLIDSPQSEEVAAVAP